MKSNLVIIGDNENTNKNIGAVLANMLELNYLDFDGYCEYVNLINREDLISNFGKRKYNELQKETLPHMQDFCDSVIAFDGKISRLPSVFKLLNKSAYIVCVSGDGKEKYDKYVDIWINRGKKSTKKIIDEIYRKLGEVQ